MRPAASRRRLACLRSRVNPAYPYFMVRANSEHASSYVSAWNPGFSLIARSTALAISPAKSWLLGEFRSAKKETPQPQEIGARYADLGRTLTGSALRIDYDIETAARLPPPDAAFLLWTKPQADDRELKSAIRAALVLQPVRLPARHGRDRMRQVRTPLVRQEPGVSAFSGRVFL
jgi:hypothetical protein